MTTLKRWFKTKPEVVAVVLGFAIGLGLALHEMFFLVPLVFALIVVGEWMFGKTHEYVRHFHPRLRHP